MWNYEKRLQYPVKITQTNPKIAKIIISQFGGPDGELAASMRYLSQRYTMPYKEVTGTLTDIGTEELAHMEMVCAIVYQLTKDLSPEEIERSGFAPYYVDHTLALWPQAASGAPWTATYFQSKGDPITDHGFHFQLELFFYALLFFTKHKNVIDRDIDVSLMIFSTYILPNLRCVNNHYSLFLFFL